MPKIGHGNQSIRKSINEIHAKCSFVWCGSWLKIGESVTDRNENRPGYGETKLGYLFENSKKVGISGLPIFSVTINSGLIHRKTLDRKMAPDLPPEKSLLVEPGDIVYNMMRMWQGAVAVCNRRGIVSPAYVVCNPTSKINSNFAYHFFKTPYMLHKLKSFSYGITDDRLRLYYKDFAIIPVKIPPLFEQKKIAKILSTWDDAIEQTRMLIDAKKRLKKALMQQLLTGKKRLPGFAKTEDRKEYRFFDLPADWKWIRIREFAKECSERNTQRDKLTVLSCSKHVGFVESSAYFGKQVFSEDTSNYKIIRHGYFGYPSNHIEEGSIGLLLSHEIGMVSPIYTVFKCNENVSCISWFISVVQYRSTSWKSKPHLAHPNTNCPAIWKKYSASFRLCSC